MAISFASDHASFDSTSSLDQQLLQRSANFPRPVRTAQVVLQGYRVQYDNGDHHVAVERAGIQNVQVSGTAVRFDVFITLRDNDNSPYSGAISSIVIADLE